MSLINRFVGTTLDLLLTQHAQERLGRFILHRARCEDDDDSVTNGEYALLRRLATSANPPSVIFDVGANKGEWTQQACAHFSQSAEFFAFEPVAATHAYLATEFATTGGERKVNVVHLALGDDDGTAEMQVSGNLAGSNSLYKRQGTRVKGESVESVRVARGDTFCHERGIQRVGFLKIDTEGHELAVLRGFEQLLKTHAIDVVQFEYGGTWIDARTLLKDAFNLLQNHGYRLGRVMPNEVRFMDRYQQELENFHYANWVAVAPGQDELQRSLAHGR